MTLSFKSRALVACFAVLVWAAQVSADTNAARHTQIATTNATGVVFHDRNRNSRRDAGEEALSNVAVSNGREVTRTNADGRYSLSVGDDTILFVIKPRNFMTPLSADNLPRFHYIHKPAGSPADLQYKGVAPTGALPASIDFPLHARAESDKFRIVLFGDTQPRDQTEIDYIAHDVVEGLIGTEAAFGITLGDILFGDLSLFESLNRTIATIGIPWYNTIGNHDLNLDASSNELADETFERVYGPSYYAFEYGAVHFISLNTVEWLGQNATPRYKGKIGARQLEFVRNYLATVPRDRLIVLTMHIPLNEVEDSKELFRLLADRPHTFSISAHKHAQQHRFFKAEDGWTGAEGHHHLNHAAVSGSQWAGAPDENGIPHATMRDGTPNGYSLVTFDGNRYSVEFRAARRPASHQMNIFAPQLIAPNESSQAEVLVNVFAGSERSRVEMRVRGVGDWMPLERVEREDPYYLRLKVQETSSMPPPGRKLPSAVRSVHIWAGRLPPNLPTGSQVIEVRTTDMFGHTYEDRRLIRVR